MKKTLWLTVFFCICLTGYTQEYGDSLIHFVLIKNTTDTVQSESNLTWQDLHTLSAKVKLHALTARYGVTHPKGIIYFEVFCNTKTGWSSAGTTEIPFILTASILTEPIGVYSYLKMKRASGKIQIKVKKIVLISNSEKHIEVYFSDQKSKIFYLTGKDSTW
jgi:hypothetical protein